MFCLGLESLLCCGPSISAARLQIMDLYDLRSDPCDNRIIRLTNFLMCFACILDIASIFVPMLDNAALIIGLLADTVFYSALGCMVSQVRYPIILDFLSPLK